MADLPFTLDQLRILRAIVSEGSFKKAADSLYVTQPAVSLQIQNLEKQLEVSLFDRGGRKAQLTEAGHLLLSYCDRILSQCHEACRALDDLHNLKGGSLIVGASQTTGTYLMPRMIGLFRQKYPDVSVQLQVHSTRRTGWSVANGQIDLAIIGGELPAELNELLQVVPYASDELALVLPVKHPLARLAELTKEDLYRLGFVCLDAQSTTRKMVDQLLARSGLLPALSAFPSTESVTSYSFAAMLFAPTLIWMLIWGGCGCGPRDAGAFGFSNDRSLVYCASTLSWGGAPAPGGLPLPLVMIFSPGRGRRSGEWLS